MSFVIFNEKEWGDILKNHPKPCDDIKELIWEKTRNFYILKNISFSDANEDFYNLKKMDSSELIKSGELFSRYDYKWDLGEKYIDFSNIGNKSSNYFHQENRYKCDSINAPSPYRTWNDKKFFFTLLNSLWTLKVKEVTDDTLRSGIALRKYIASQFRPSAAKAIYEHFNAKHVLDFSSGWGDRLTAAMATNKLEAYVGIDPNIVLYDGYNKQIEEFNKNKNIKMIMQPAEEALNELEFSPDLVFTSPPYFIIERYSKDSTQSWKRYKKLNDWLDKFLFSVIEKSWNLLKNGGHMAINISDVYCNHTINRICDPMNDFISGLENSTKCENLNYRMAKRMNSKSERSGLFVEPIWVWKKKLD
jgi:tRNA1(Val) A37 N6-methylase TrmN6